MNVPATTAANAYAAAARAIAQAEKGGTGGKTGAEAKDFSSMLQDVVGGVVESGQQADKAKMTFAAGKADLVDVVTAVSETELAVQTLVSVRDRVISAYQEIIRMPI